MPFYDCTSRLYETLNQASDLAWELSATKINIWEMYSCFLSG